MKKDIFSIKWEELSEWDDWNASIYTNWTCKFCGNVNSKTMTTCVKCNKQI